MFIVLSVPPPCGGKCDNDNFQNCCNQRSCSDQTFAKCMTDAGGRLCAYPTMMFPDEMPFYAEPHECRAVRMIRQCNPHDAENISMTREPANASPKMSASAGSLRRKPCFFERRNLGHAGINHPDCFPRKDNVFSSILCYFKANFSMLLFNEKRDSFPVILFSIPCFKMKVNLFSIPPIIFVNLNKYKGFF